MKKMKMSTKRNYREEQAKNLELKNIITEIENLPRGQKVEIDIFPKIYKYLIST